MRFCGSAALSLALLATVCSAQAQEPVGSVIPPRTDLYSVYADAYLNPMSAGPANSDIYDSKPGMWNLARRWKYYGGASFLQLSRTNPDNQVLLRNDPARIPDPDTPGQFLKPSFAPSPDGTDPRPDGFGTAVITDDRPFRTVLLETDNFDYGNERDGWRVTLGVELSDTDMVDVSFEKLSSSLPAQLVRTTNPNISTFALEIQNEVSAAGPAVWYPRLDPTTNPNDAGISRYGENFGAQYIDDQMWALDLLWRHALDFFEFKGSNWRVLTLSGLRVVHTSENFQMFWNRNTVPGWDPFGQNPVFFVRQTPSITLNPVDPTVIVPSSLDPAGTAVDGFGMELDVRNLIIGPQIGLQAKRRFYEIFEFDLVGKGGLMANFAEVSQDVRRFDGLVIPDPFRAPFTRNETMTAGVLETRLGLNFYPHPNVRLQVAFEGMYLNNIVTATHQIQPDLDRTQRPNAEDDALYTGWSGTVEIKF